MLDNSAMNTLKGLLGDNAEEKIQKVMSSLSGNSEEGSENLPILSEPLSASTDNSLEYIMRIKGIIDELSSNATDSRSNLLLSLKPFMRSSRQQSIDSAVKLLSLSKLTTLFKL